MPAIFGRSRPIFVAQYGSLKFQSREPPKARRVISPQTGESLMGFGRGALLWLIGIPLPIILLLAIFMHH
jgi:hypothetical protein